MRKSRSFGVAARARGALVVGLAVACGSFAAGAAAQQDSRGLAPQVVEVPGSMEFSGRMIAKPVQPGAERGMQAVHDAAVAKLYGEYRVLFREDFVDHYIFEVPAESNEQRVIDDLTATGLFEFVEPDWILYPIGCPNDTRFNNQWHHNDNRMESCDAWGIHTGNPSVGVGICDTGIQTNHPDLLLHRLEGYNAVDRRWESQGGQIGPVASHGTQTTGCAAANGNNNTGVSGVGWNLSHRMMRVSNSGGSSSLSTLTHAALTSITAGDKVANVSYSGVNSSSVRSTATQIKNLGGLLTWSAGNDGANLNWGNRDNDDVIVVGATTNSDSKSSFSAFGPSVDLMAPGSSVHTTTTGSGYASVSGTSFSAPLTAGLIGLIWSFDPSLTPDEVEEILKNGCDDLGTAGVDNTYGYGRINSYNSLLLIGGDPNDPPVITVNSPTQGSVFNEGTSISFNSTTIDPEDGDISSQVSWTSSLDGLLGTGNFSRSDLSVGTHFIDIEVTDSGGLSDFEFISIAVNPTSIPNTPTAINTQEGAPGDLTLNWTDNSNNETGFGVQRQEKVGGAWTNLTNVGSTGPNATSFTESVASGGWRYRVRALGSGGNSAWSAYKAAKAARPTGMSASLSGSTVNIGWNDNSGIETGYRIQRQQRVGGVWTNTTVIGTVGPDVTSSSDAPGSGEWRYRVQATTLTLYSQYSVWSNKVTIP